MWSDKQTHHQKRNYTKIWMAFQIYLIAIHNFVHSWRERKNLSFQIGSKKRFTMLKQGLKSVGKLHTLSCFYFIV